MLEELEQARQQLEKVRSGELKANHACEMVNNWLMLSVYDVAYSVANQPSKELRKKAMQTVSETMPDFVDDVREMAKKIFNK